MNFYDPDGRSRIRARKVAEALKLQRQFRNAAKRAIKQAWKEEQQLVKEGLSTRSWTKEQKVELLKNGKVKGFEGHHINSVNGNSLESAANANNIMFLTKKEHAALHAGKGGTRVAITGQTMLNRSFGGRYPRLPQRKSLPENAGDIFMSMGVAAGTILDMTDPFTYYDAIGHAVLNSMEASGVWGGGAPEEI